MKEISLEISSSKTEQEQAITRLAPVFYLENYSDFSVGAFLAAPAPDLSKRNKDIPASFVKFTKQTGLAFF